MLRRYECSVATPCGYERHMATPMSSVDLVAPVITLGHHVALRKRGHLYRATMLLTLHSAS
jgi:hypothetical protein